MSVYTGDQGVFKTITTGGTPAAVGEILDFEVTTSAASIDTTAKGDSWTTNTAGRKSWTARCSMHLDPADGAHADLLEGDKVDCEFFFTGEDSGKEELNGTALVTNCVRTSPEGDSKATYAVDLVGDGALTHTTVGA